MTFLKYRKMRVDNLILKKFYMSNQKFLISNRVLIFLFWQHENRPILASASMYCLIDEFYYSLFKIQLGF